MHLIPNQTAEELLRDGTINEIEIRHTDLKKARLEIGLSLLKHSGTNLYNSYIINIE